MEKKKTKFFKIFSLFFLILISINFISAPRLPIVNGDGSNWGSVLNEYLTSLSGENATSLNQTMVNGTNVYDSSINTTHLVDGTITDADISDTTNLTLGEKITFTFGEIIDNIANGWITITGGLNVTENITVEGNVTADYFIGNGSQLTGISEDNWNANYSAFNATWSNITNYSYIPYTGANQNVDLGNNNLTINGTTLFVNTNNSRVGIGTTSPTSKLTINGGVGSLATGLAFGDGDSGLYELSDDNFVLYAGGGAHYFSPAYYRFGTGYAAYLYYTTSATVPTYAFGADSDTGIGRGGENIMSFITGGNNIMNINGANVGIGTINPFTTLHVNGSILANGTINATVDVCVPNKGVCLSNASTNLSYIPYTGANQNVDLGNNNLTINGTTLFVNTNNSRVGIGTTAPTTKLHVEGVSANIYLKFDDTTTGGLNIGGTGPSVELTDINTNEDDFKLTNNADVFSIQNQINDAGGWLDRLSIISNGNVGIGTTNPFQALHVNGSILANGTINATGGFGVNSSVGLTGNYSLGICFQTFTGGILTGTNCTAL